MTTVTLTSDSEVDIFTLDITTFWANSGSVYHTNTACVVDAGIDFVFQGTGFTKFDAHGYATRGSVTSFGMVIGPTRIDFTDFTLKASQLEQAFKTGNTAQLNQLLLGHDDHITANAGGATAGGFGGDDTLTGLGGNDTFFGGTGDDTINGNGGVDRIEGDAGADILSGGPGADSFVYLSTGDSHGGHADTITDLTDTDVIDIASVDANSALIGDQDFNIVASFNGTAGQMTLTFDAAHNRTVIKGYTDTDSKADLVIYVSGDHHDFTTFDGAG